MSELYGIGLFEFKFDHFNVVLAIESDHFLDLLYNYFLLLFLEFFEVEGEDGDDHTLNLLVEHRVQNDFV